VYNIFKMREKENIKNKEESSMSKTAQSKIPALQGSGPASGRETLNGEGPFLFGRSI
jgi:hypothetical protein